MRRQNKEVWRWWICFLGLAELAFLASGASFAAVRAAYGPSDSELRAGVYDNATSPLPVAVIDSAKQTLDIEMYEMDDPDVIAAVRRALGRGVAVRVVKEPVPVGASCKIFGAATVLPDILGDNATCEDRRALAREVNATAGGAYVPFAKPALCKDGKRRCLEHGKLMIADQQTALISTGNFNTTSLCNQKYHPANCNRDFTVIVTDRAAIDTLREVVSKDQIGKRYDMGAVLPPEVGQKLTVGPETLAPLVAFVNSARTRLLVEHQYLKDPTLNEALMAAARRGVKIEVTLSHPCHFGWPKPNEREKLQRIYGAMEDAGIALRFFTRKMKINNRPGYLHAKAIVVDDAKAWVGSANGSTQALTLNREFGVFVEDQESLAMLKDTLTRDHHHPLAIASRDAIACVDR